MSMPPTNPYAPPQTPSGTLPPPQGFVPPLGSVPVAPCPRCQTPYATPISFTWWGGLLGPKLFHHVRCCACGTQFNGKTGRSNSTAIAIYVAVGAVLGLIVGLMAAGMLFSG